VRPERVQIADPAAPATDGTISLSGRVLETVYAGAHTRYLVETESGMRFISEKQNNQSPRTDPVQRGDTVSLRFERSHAVAVPGAPVAAPGEPAAV
jgi:putative spermidine/putrescine transport system ATP-binding protein